jgi:hypothetical protein
VAGYTGYSACWIKRHINRDTHGGDYMHGMRKTYGCFVVIIMAGDAYFVGFAGEGYIAFVERQQWMAVITMDLSAFIVDGICAVKRNEGK